MSSVVGTPTLRQPPKPMATNNLRNTPSSQIQGTNATLFQAWCRHRGQRPFTIFSPRRRQIHPQQHERHEARPATKLFPPPRHTLARTFAASLAALVSDKCVTGNQLSLPAFPSYAKTQPPNGEVNQRQQGGSFKAIEILRRNQLTVELWRPAPGETIKTNSPTQGNTQEKVPLLGSPTNDLLAGPNDCKHPLNIYTTITQNLETSNDPQ